MRYPCILLALALACSRPPPLHNTLQGHITEFLREGTRMDVLTSQGTSYMEFSAQLVNTNTAYLMMLNSLPLLDASSPQTRATFHLALEEFERTVKGWELLLTLWGWMIEKLPIPQEFCKTKDDILGRRWKVAMDMYTHMLMSTQILFPGEQVLVTEPSKTTACRDSNSLPYKANITALMTRVGISFEKGRIIVNPLLLKQEPL